MKIFKFSINWLKFVSIIFALFGIVIAIFNQTLFFNFIFNNQINPSFFDNLPLAPDILQFQRWAYGVLGATCIMIGIMLFFITENALKSKEKWAWNCIFISLICWFIVDESISIYFEVYFNAIFNLVLLISIIIPLLFIKSEMR